MELEKRRHIVAENLERCEPKNDSDKKVYTADIEAHIKNCFAVRHEAAKAIKRKIYNFGSYGTIAYPVMRSDKRSKWAPLPSHFITADNKKIDLYVDRNTFLINVTVYSKNEPTLEFTFQRCLKAFKNGNYAIRGNFLCVTKYKGTTKELDADIHREYGLNEQSVAWALYDLLRTLIDTNYQRRNLADSERMEIIVHEELFDGDRRHVLDYKKHDVYEYSITGYIGKSTCTTVDTQPRSDQVPQ